ncbi:MAG: hypothetical protein IJO62_04465 [Clostridia bacterium]|nr:hypothetical protein [Clostridia bacterium]
MVKGVNKRVIEVNNTGNKFFEKIVFYVTPEYGDLTAEQIYDAAEYLSLGLGQTAALGVPTLRKNRKKQKNCLILTVTIGILALVGLGLKLIL